MNGKTILITGATEGLGHKTARELAQMGANVLVHGRASFGLLRQRVLANL